jgi:16S rRNA processing protein RimM
VTTKERDVRGNVPPGDPRGPLGSGDSRGNAPSDLLRVGRVVRAVGLKGALEVRLDWSDSQALLESERVVLTLEDGKTELRSIEAVRPAHKGVLVQLEGLLERDAAEARAGATVSVRRSDLPPLSEGEYYLCDLVGLEVFGPDGALGRVIEVQMYPSVDAVVIEAPSGERFEQPLLEEWLERVDVEAGSLRLSSLAGLIELGRPVPREPKQPRTKQPATKQPPTKPRAAPGKG